MIKMADDSDDTSSYETPTSQTSGSQTSAEDASFDVHMSLIGANGPRDSRSELAGTPIFTEAIRQHGLMLSEQRRGTDEPFTQYGLLGAIVSDSSGVSRPPDPRLFYNVAAPSSIFICGSQGSGKSHTLSCLLENCLLPSRANVLPNPLTGIVFHYDTFFSDNSGSPCEAAYLSSNRGLRVRVLCSPTNIRQIEKIYSSLPNVTVESLYIDQSDLNTKRMLDLMAVASVQGDAAPLYIYTIIRILREMRTEQQVTGESFNYQLFKSKMDSLELVRGQNGPLEQRIDILESFMNKDQTNRHVSRKMKKRQASRGRNIWKPVAGQLTIVDLSCPCITADTACALFNICLSLFIEQDNSIGRVVALDEAHKYMMDSTEATELTNALLSTIRLQRHVAARIFISTQEPTISPKLLDLCSVTIVHRFSSPAWLSVLKGHLAGASSLVEAESGDGDPLSGLVEAVGPLSPGVTERRLSSAARIFQKIVSLHTGEALLFAPSAALGLLPADALVHDERDNTAPGTSASEVGLATKRQCKASIARLGHGILKVRVRNRITEDGGSSVMAS